MQTYDVAYMIDAPAYDNEPYMSTVAITEGYTTVDDIPQIIALKCGVTKDQVRILATAKS